MGRQAIGGRPLNDGLCRHSRTRTAQFPHNTSGGWSTLSTRSQHLSSFLRSIPTWNGGWSTLSTRSQHLSYFLAAARKTNSSGATCSPPRS